MNIQKDGINWTDATWNPITGCLHNCPYCYARAMANRFGRSFKPKFHPERLNEPKTIHKPLKIFCGSTADNFGNWVPRPWMDAILRTVTACPQHTFQFLTKAPQNLIKYNPWPNNCWVGASATDQRMMDNAVFVLNLCKAPVRFISAEPLLGQIDTDLAGINWLIIGAQTGPCGRQPHAEWIQSLIDAARRSGTAVWFKDNLEWHCRVNEWPQTQEFTMPAQLAMFDR